MIKAKNGSWIFDATNRTWTSGPPMRQARWDHGCFSVYTNNVVTQIIVVGGVCWGRNDPDCPWGSPYLKSTEILNIADMTWTSGPDFPYGIDGNRGATGIQDGYLGYSIGGVKEVDGEGSDALEIMGLQNSNEGLRWVSVGELNGEEPGAENARSEGHSARKVPMSLIPSC